MSPENQRRTFISYSRINKEFALKLARELRSSGFNVWLDQLDIPPGARWDDAVEQALEDCEIFLVILTPASSTSNNVKDEIGYAIDTGKRILPVLLKNAKVPLRLRRFQYVDFTAKSDEEGIESAKQLLRKLIEEPTIPREQASAVPQTQKAKADHKTQEDADRLKAQKAEEERIARENRAAEQLAAQQAEADRKAKEEADRLKAQKAEEERIAREKRAAVQLAAQQAEAERKAKEEAKRLAAQKAEEEMLAKEKREHEKIQLQTDAQVPETSPSSIPHKLEPVSTTIKKKSRLPLILGVAGIGSLAILAVIVFVLLNLTRGAIPVTSSQDANLSVELDYTVTPTNPSTPKPTSTPKPKPTSTPIPKSGDLLYETTFNDTDNWHISTKSNEAEYTNEAGSDGLYVKVPNDDDYWYAYYNIGQGLKDVRIEADAELVGNNNYTYIALVCRSSEKGEYDFFLDTGGYWQIGKWDYEADSYEQLGYGGSTSIKVLNHPNHISAICKGDKLTMLINDYEVGSVQDSQFAEGDFGIGVETFDYPLTEVVFHNLQIYVP